MDTNLHLEEQLGVTVDDGSSTMNPFPGLRPFEMWENYLFFGRDRQVDALLKKLGEQHFVAVVGTSGSGKSSLVRAGLLPSLYGGYMVSAGSTWRVALMRPGSSPIRNLAEALSSPDVFGDTAMDDGASSNDPERKSDVDRRTAVLETSSLGLVQAVRQAELPSEENLLIVVDQFEELFRFKDNQSIADAANEAAAFVKLLLEAVHQRELSIYVLLTLRSDFLGDCAQFRDLPETINEGHYLIPRLRREEQREAILGPVAVGGGKISPRLVQQLLNDLGDNPDQLPILQHALMRTWDEWQRHHEPGEPIDFRHYEAIGRMAQALSQHADEAFRELSSDRSRSICESIFKSLTMRGADNRGIRRPTRISEICAIAEADAPEVIEVVECFRKPGRSFVTPPFGVPLTSHTVLDISHESLMRVWSRLEEWVNDDAESAQMYTRLVESSLLHEKEEAGLWRDPELQQAINWRDTHRPNEAWALRYAPSFGPTMGFLDDSIRQRDRERTEKRRRQRMINAFIFAFLAFAGILTVWALSERSSATESATLAQKQQKFAEEQKQLAQKQKTQAEQSALFAEQSEAKALGAQTESEQQKKIAESQRAAALAQKQQADEARAEAEHSSQAANEQRIAALRESHIADSLKKEAENSAKAVSRLRLLSISKALAIKAGHIQTQDPQLEGLLALQAYQFNQANGGSSLDPDIFGALHTANERMNKASLTLGGPNATHVRGILYSKNGSVVSAGADGTITEWSPKGSSHIIGKLRGSHTIALSADGSQLVAAGDDRHLHIFAMNGGMPVADLPVDIAHIVQCAFVDDATIAVLDNEGGVRILSRADGSPRGAISLAAPVKSIAVSRSGGFLAAGDAKGHVGIWLLTAFSTTPTNGTWAESKNLGTAPGPVCSIAVSPDGKMVASGTERGAVNLWSIGGTRAAQLALTNNLPIPSVTFSPDGSMLATGSSDGKVRLWNPRRLGDLPIVVNDNPGWIWACAFSPDGNSLAVSCADRSVHLIPTHPDHMVGQISPHITRNLTEAEWEEYIGTDVPYMKTVAAN